MGVVIDTATRIPGSALKAANVTCVVRYLSSIAGPKIITRDEVGDLRANGIGLLLVYEDTITDMEVGFDGGIRHGQIAVYEAASVGYPQGCAIFFASDNKPVLPNTRDTFGAANFVAHHYGYQTGWYGKPETGYLFMSGFGNRYDQCDYVWGVSTWGDCSHAHLVQDANHPQFSVNGTGVDWNIAQVGNFGQWA